MVVWVVFRVYWILKLWGRDLGKLSWQIGQIGEYWPILVPIPGKLINIPTPTRAPTRVAVAVLCDSHLLQAKSTCSD